jgi:DNA-binding IclR family transcriptional regulator
MSEQRVEAVERALSILEAFNDEKSKMSLNEMAEETGLYKSTILRLSASLERYGYLNRDNLGYFRIGPSLWRLGSLYRRTFNLGMYIRPELRQILNETGETSSFYIIEDNERVCLYRENSNHPIRYHLEEGSRLSLDKGAAAHVLCSYSKIPTPNQAEVLKNGYSITVGERTPDVSAVSVPLFDLKKNLKGALSVSGPSNRFNTVEIMKALKVLQDSANRLHSIMH